MSLIHLAWVVGLALLLILTAPRAGAAATCTSTISGPNDPGYAGAERNFH